MMLLFGNLLQVLTADRGLGFERRKIGLINIFLGQKRAQLMESGFREGDMCRWHASGERGREWERVIILTK
jgi:hypothetical protein